MTCSPCALKAMQQSPSQSFQTFDMNNWWIAGLAVVGLLFAAMVFARPK